MKPYKLLKHKGSYRLCGFGVHKAFATWVFMMIFEKNKVVKRDFNTRRISLGGLRWILKNQHTDSICHAIGQS